MGAMGREILPVLHQHGGGNIVFTKGGHQEKFLEDKGYIVCAMY